MFVSVRVGVCVCVCGGGAQGYQLACQVGAGCLSPPFGACWSGDWGGRKGGIACVQVRVDASGGGFD